MSQTGNGQESDIPLEFQERVAKAKAEAKARQEARHMAQQEAKIRGQQERDKVSRMGRWTAEMLRKAQVPYDAVRTQTTLAERVVLFWKGPMYRGKRGMRGWQLIRPTNLAGNDERQETFYDVVLEPDGTVVHRVNGVDLSEQAERAASVWKHYSNHEIEQALIDLLSEKT